MFLKELQVIFIPIIITLMKEDLDHAIGVVAGLYRFEFTKRTRPYQDPSITSAERTKIWENLASLHRKPIDSRIIMLRQLLVHSYQNPLPFQLTPLFENYFYQQALKASRPLENQSYTFKIWFGEREIFLADLLSQRLTKNLNTLELHQAKSVFLSEFLGENLSLVPPSVKGIKPDDDQFEGETSKFIENSYKVSCLTFGDIIKATLSDKVGFDLIDPKSCSTT